MKPNSDPVVPTINIWSRMLQVWTNIAFLKTVLYREQDKAVGRTWLYWFVWNTLIAIGASIGIWFVLAQNWVVWAENQWWSTVPDFEASVENGELSTNLPEPYIVFEEANEALVVIDTQGVEYTEESLQPYRGGVVVSAEKFMAKEETGEFRSFYFSEFEEDFTFTKTDAETFWYEIKPSVLAWGIGFMFLGIWLWLCIIRLLTALWWALIFWGIGNMAQVPEWTFTRSYLSVLNFYIIPLVFETGLLLIGVGLLPFSTLLVLGLVFGLNFYAFKAEPPQDQTVQRG